MGSIVIADVHLQRSYTSGKGLDDHFNSLEDVFRMAEDMSQTTVTPIIMAGDIFDTTKVTPSSLQRALEIFDRHPSIPIYFINGNHDPEDGQQISWMKFCERAIELGPEKTILPDGLTVAGMSWRVNSRIVEDMQQVDHSVDCLFVHQFIEPVYSLDDEFRSIIQNALPSTLYKDFKAVIAGDVHKQQVNVGSIPPLAYPGPTCPCNLIEEPGCLYISKTQEPDCQPFGGFFVKAIQLPKRPVLDYKIKALTHETLEDVASYIDNDLSKLQNTFINEREGALEIERPWIVLRSPTMDGKAVEAISKRFKPYGDVLVRPISASANTITEDIEACETLPSQSISEYIVSRLTYENLDDTMKARLTDLILHEQSFIEDTQRKLGLE